MRVRHTKTIRINRRNFGMGIENSKSKEQNVRWKKSLDSHNSNSFSLEFKRMRRQPKCWKMMFVRMFEI